MRPATDLNNEPAKLVRRARRTSSGCRAVGVKTTRTPRPGPRPPPAWYDISGYGYDQRAGMVKVVAFGIGHGSSPAGVLGVCLFLFRSTVTR